MLDEAQRILMVFFFVCLGVYSHLCVHVYKETCHVSRSPINFARIELSTWLKAPQKIDTRFCIIRRVYMPPTFLMIESMTYKGMSLRCGWICCQYPGRRVSS